MLFYFCIIHGFRHFIVVLQVKDQYMRAVSELNQQNAQLKEELKSTKNDLKVANIQVDDLKKVLEDLRNEMLLKVTPFSILSTIDCVCVMCHKKKMSFKIFIYILHLP